MHQTRADRVAQLTTELDAAKEGWRAADDAVDSVAAGDAGVRVVADQVLLDAAKEDYWNHSLRMALAMGPEPSWEDILAGRQVR